MASIIQHGWDSQILGCCLSKTNWCYTCWCVYHSIVLVTKYGCFSNYPCWSEWGLSMVSFQFFLTFVFMGQRSWLLVGVIFFLIFLCTLNTIHFSYSVYNMAGVTCDCTWFYFLVWNFKWLAILIRVNRSIFSGASNVDSFASGKEIVNVRLPSISSMDGSQTEDSDEPVVDNSVSKDVSVSATFIKQIPELVTLSLLPKSQWQSLINLDIIKVSLFPLNSFILSS